MESFSYVCYGYNPIQVWYMDNKKGFLDDIPKTLQFNKIEEVVTGSTSHKQKIPLKCSKNNRWHVGPKKRLYKITNCYTLTTRVDSIFQKLRYLKDQVMWSNTMLWGMFIPIFKLLTLKLSNHWIAQFYEAISLNFRLIKYSDE